MNLRTHLHAMAGWNRWCYERLYAVADRLSDADYRRDAGLFFRSVHGSINHMLLVEEIWRARLAGTPLPVTDLGQEIEPDRERLKSRLLASALAWQTYVEQTGDATLFAEFDYRNLAGQAFRLPRSVVVHTMFTHGAHHRGQVSTALTQMGQDAPVLDYPLFYFDYQKSLEL